MRHLGITEAAELARSAHAGQTSPDGRPYIEHSLRVAHAVRSAGGDTTAVVVSLLHDSIEKGNATREQLRAAGATKAIMAAVDALTRRAQEPASAYLDRCRDNPIAHTAKRYDLLDKLQPRYLSAPSGLEAALAATVQTKLDELGGDRAGVTGAARRSGGQ
jgi:HD domain